MSSLFSTTDTAATPVEAATVLLVRDGAPFEVYLVKRASKSAFMGGMFVFPGGKLDEVDATVPTLDPTAAARCVEALEATPGVELTNEVAAGLYVCACRELFEEAGVLFAKSRSGVALNVDRLAEHRRALRAATMSFAEVLTAEDLDLDVSPLAYFAHWITPSREKRRYDTRFFIARHPPGQKPIIDEEETVDSAWMSPADALDAYRAGTIALSPPTMRTLEDLALARSVDGVFELTKRRTIAAVLPKVGVAGQNIAILLPWDPLYAETEGEAVAVPEPHPTAEGASRIVLEGQQWVSRSP